MGVNVCSWQVLAPGAIIPVLGSRVPAAELGRYAATGLRDPSGEGLTDLAAARPDGEQRSDQQVE